MPLHRFLGIEIGVPEPAILEACYREIGLEGGSGLWGTADVSGQIRIEETRVRRLLAMRVGCHDEADLDRIARRLDGLGAKHQRGDGKLRATDPVNGWDVVVEPAPRMDLTVQPPRILNGPSSRGRQGSRAEPVVQREAPRPPRRLGHCVVGTHDPLKTAEFMLDGIGYRLTDKIAGGAAQFMRCSSDHHNLLIAPGPCPHLNHYAFEQDDIDGVGHAASRYLREHPDRDISGIGRHVIGSNVFWYMLDPSGNMFEFFTDMDCITDDGSAPSSVEIVRWRNLPS